MDSPIGTSSAGMPSEKNRFDRQPETDPRFERGIDAARRSMREGHGIKLEDIDLEN
ncbi:MAG TPA: hypothetical protein VG308_17200 [Stellaceae bacterium]|jgi:hypothetical protein|nr:hypothetical protein [Stellaceae bacterium]